MDSEEKRRLLEVSIIRIIKDHLEKGSMDADRASGIAKLVLKALPPHISLEDFYKVVPSLDDHFTELSEAILPILKEYEEQVEKKVREKVIELVKSGKFGDAVNVAEEFQNKNK